MTTSSAPADLEGALAELGVEVYRTTDDEVSAYCPGHLSRLGRTDTHASWSVNRDSGLHNCFSCGFSGTFLDLVMALQFPNDVFRAARWLRQFGVNLTRAMSLTTYEETVAGRAEVDAPALVVPETRLAAYDEVPDAALADRRLDRESVEHHGVRWNSRNAAWVIPVRLPDGELLGWQERYTKVRRVLNRPKEMEKSRTLFGLDVFPVGEPAVLLESPLDVCRLRAAGFAGGVACFGSAVSLTQLRLLADATDELVCALDNDAAGRKTADQLRWGVWEGRKLVRPPMTQRMHLRYLSYGRTKAKDLGDMTDEEIEVALYESAHWIQAGPAHGVTDPAAAPSRGRAGGRRVLGVGRQHQHKRVPAVGQGRPLRASTHRRPRAG